MRQNRMQERESGMRYENEARRRRTRSGEYMRRCRMRRLLYLCFVMLCCFLAFFWGRAAEARKVRTGKEKQQLVDAIVREIRAASEKEADMLPALPDDGREVTGKGKIVKEEIGKEETGKEETGCLLLVNRDNPLPEDYAPELVMLQDGVHKSAKVAYNSLRDMLRAGIREGLTFEICSAYRSVERQKQLFDEDVNALMSRGMSYEQAYEEVAKETMPPGCSEHNTGLAFDIVAFDYQLLDEGQERTDENIWLREHCAEYGFILRYPKGTEDITGIRYESWHFRYVGKEAAQEIMEQGLTLEEYLQQIG